AGRAVGRPHRPPPPLTRSRGARGAGPPAPRSAAKRPNQRERPALPALAESRRRRHRWGWLGGGRFPSPSETQNDDGPGVSRPGPYIGLLYLGASLHTVPRERLARTRR